jgi:hypothetical protein
MKKIYTLLLLFTITLFYSIPTQAYTLNDLDVDIAELNNLTLREVFIDNNLDYTASHSLSDLYYKTDGNVSNINNYYYSASTNLFDNLQPLEIGAILSDGSILFSPGFTTTQTRENIITVVGTPPVLSDAGWYTTSYIPVKPSTTYRIINNNASAGLIIGQYTSTLTWVSRINLITTNPVNFTTSATTSFIRVDPRFLPNTTYTSQFFMFEGSTNITYELYAPPTTLINLTDLGLTTVSLTRMNFYYNQFIAISAYIEGYNEGFDDGFDEGFDDGVASDTSFAVGYALGLSQGEDMETGSSLLILIVAAIGFIMMIFGFATKRRIFNLLSVGAFIVLGGLLAEFVGFIIITVGLVFVNVYYTFFGDI